MSKQSTDITVTSVLVEVLIEVQRERVWETLVVDTSEWWHEDFFTRPGLGKFRIEQKLGGWMYEDWGDGEGQIWGLVNGVKAPEFLQIAGDSDKDWGGPSRGIMTIRLKSEGEATRLSFEHSIFGRISDETRESLESGWTLLLRDCLKPMLKQASGPGTRGLPTARARTGSGRGAARKA